MSKSFNQEIQREIRRHRKARKNRRILSIACAVVACITLLGSSLPATTATADLLCEKKEHKHTEECYEIQKVLICGHDEDGITQEQYDELEARWIAEHTEASVTEEAVTQAPVTEAPVSGDAAVVEEETAEETPTETEETVETEAESDSSATEESEAAAETAVEAAAETAVEPAAESVSEPAAESVSETVTEPAEEAAPEAATETAPEETGEETTDAAAEGTVAETTPEESSGETTDASAAGTEPPEEAGTAETTSGEQNSETSGIPGEGATESAAESDTEEAAQEGSTEEIITEEDSTEGTETGARIVDGIDLDTVHVHNDTCYEEKKVLICPLEEHEHTEACYEQGGSISGSCGDITVTITYDAGELDKETSVIVDEPGEESLTDAKQRIQEDLDSESTEKQTLETAGLYPVYIQLEKDGAAAEPDGMVDAAVEFGSARPGGEGSEWRLYYVTSDGVENLGDENHSDNSLGITTDDGGAVTDLSFQTDRFGCFVLTAVQTTAKKEEKKLTSLTAEAEGVKASLKFTEGAAEEETALTISKDGDSRDAVQSQLEKVLADSQDPNVIKTLETFYTYTMTLTDGNGEKIPLPGRAEITLTFDPALTSGKEDASWMVYRWNADGTLEEETKAKIRTVDANAVTEVAFETDSLTGIVLAAVSSKEYEKAGSLTASSDSITAVVSYEDGILPKGTELSIEDLSESDELQASVNKALLSGKKKALQYFAYDLTLTCDGREVEPEGTVHVAIEWNEAVQAKKAADTWQLLHIKEDGTAENLSQDENAGVAFDAENDGKTSTLYGVGFDTDHFSKYVAADAAGTAPRRGPASEIDWTLDGTSLEPYIDAGSPEFYVIRDGQQVDNPAVVEDGETIYFNFSYTIPQVTQLTNDRLVYQINAEFTNLEEQTGHIYARNDSTRIVGEYKITTDGKVILVFTDPDFLKQDPFYGSFNFSAEAQNDSTSENEEVTISGTDTTITILPRNVSLGTTKQVWKQSNEADGKIRVTYRIVTSSDTGTNDPVEVYDFPNYSLDNYSEDLEIVPGSVKAYLVDKGYNGSSYDEADRVSVDVTQGTFEDPKNSGSSKEGYKFSTDTTLDGTNKLVFFYDVLVDPDKITGDDAVLTSQNVAVSKSGEVESNSAETTFQYHNTTLDKQGKLKTDHISWTIDVRKSGDEDVTFTDTMTYPEGTDLTQIDHELYNFKLYQYNSAGLPVEITDPSIASVTRTYDENTGKWTFTLSGDPGKYRIQYDTKLDGLDPGGGGSVSNTIEKTPDGDSSTGTVELNAREEGIQKSSPRRDPSGTSDGSTKLQWTITLTLPSDPDVDGLTLTDRFTAKDAGSDQNQLHYSTISTLAMTNDMFLSAGTDYSIAYLDSSYQETTPADENAKFYGFKIRLTQDQINTLLDRGITEIRFTYYTIADTKEESIADLTKPLHYINTVTLGDQEIETEYTLTDKDLHLYKQSTLQDGADSNDYKGGTTTGEISPAKPFIYYRIVMQVENGSTDPVSFTDQLPEELDFVEITKTSYYSLMFASADGTTHGNDVSMPAVNYQYTPTYDSGTHQLSVQVAPNSGQPFRGQYISIYYKARLNEAGLAKLKNDGSISVTNSAAYFDKTAETTDTLTSTIVSKAGEYEYDSQTNQITYYLVVNPGGADLDEQAEILTLTDTISASDLIGETESGMVALNLDESYGVTFYQYDPTQEHGKGTQLHGDGGSAYSYVLSDTDTGKQLTIQIPDETPLVISYRYKISYKGVTGEHPSVSNSISLNGQWSDGTSTSIAISESGSTAGKYVLNVYKIRTNHYEVRIPNVHFQLEKYQNGAWSAVQDTDYITDENGSIALSNLDFDALYRLTETQNNENGYSSWADDPDSLQHYFVYLKSSTWDDIAKPDNLDESSVAFLTGESTMYIENPYTAVNVRKVWKDSNGEDISSSAEVVGKEIHITLKRYVKNQDEPDENYVLDDGFEITATLKASSWSHGFNDTELNEEAGKTYRYYVTEDADSISADFEVTYQKIDGSNGTEIVDMKEGSVDGISEGTLIISNQKVDHQYELPSTGGTGAAPYMAGGLALITMAAILYITQRHTQRERR